MQMQQILTSGKIEGLKLDSEEAFILRLLRKTFSGGDEGPRLPWSDVSSLRWGRVFEIALKWNIAPMLYPLIKDRPDLRNGSNIPDDVFKTMEAAHIKTVMVNLANFSELAEIVKALTAADIQVILLKGAHLAQWVYPHIGFRWMADIDVLVRKEDLEKADGLLAKMGYEYPDMAPAVWDDFGERKQVRDQAAVLDWYKTDHMHLVYYNPKSIKSLELHWGIARNASPFAVDTEGLWKRARAEKMHGETVWVLCPEDLLLHICLHDSYYHHLHRFGLRPCCDLAAVVSRYYKEIDWRRLQGRAREWGIEKYLYLMLRLSRELLCADIPADLLHSTQDERCSDTIFLQAARRLLGKEIDTPTYKGIKYPIEIHMFNPNEGLFQKIGFFLKRIPISREELAFRYGLPVSCTRIWLYYLTRLASLIFSYSRIYVPYFWFQLNRRNYRGHYTLDLWIKSPTSRKQIPLR